MALIRSLILEKVSRHPRESKGSTAVSNRAHSSPHSLVPAAPRSNRGEKGAEMLEFALIVAGLMMLSLGVYAFARAYNVYQTITRAAREGARVAVLPTSAYNGNSLTYLTSDGACPGTATNNPGTPVFTGPISRALQASSLDPNNVKDYQECVGWIDPSDSYKQCGLTISFTYPYRLQIPFTTTGLATMNLHTNVQMRVENLNYTKNPDGTFNQACP